MVRLYWSLPVLTRPHQRQVFPVGPQPRTSTPVSPAEHPPPPATPSVPRETSTTTTRAQYPPRYLNRHHPRPVFLVRHQLQSQQNVHSCIASECSVTGTHKECQRMLNERSDRISKYISVRIESQMETYVLTCPDMPWWKFMCCIKACNKWLHKYSSLYCFPCLKSHYLLAFLRSRTSVV